VTLWLVRHGLPLVKPGVCYGTLDVAADPHSTREAAHALADVLPQGLQVLFSPLQRCKLLALDLQGLRADLSYKSEDRLVELNFGCHEGRRWDGIDPQAYDAWTADFWNHRFGGVESLADLMARVAALWREASRSAPDQVWITHAGVIRAASLLARGVRRVDEASQWPAAAPGFGQWVAVDTSVGLTIP